MTVENVNILSVEMDEAVDEAGFRHRATSLGRRLGAERIGASVYEAEAGSWIWPYHYHHGIEEWLYVIAGAPVLRDPAGERALTPGDLVRFPSGHRGAHTLSGPGRFVIFSTGRHAGPWMSVYPDSDKVSGPGGIFVRSSAVGYWHGEGTGASSPATEVVAETEEPPSQLLDATMLDLAPGREGDDYAYCHGREVWLLVVSGTPSLRRPHGEDRLRRGDVVCFPEGPHGAHRLLNRSESAVRALRVSTTGHPANVHFPDSGRWLLRNAPGTDDVVVEPPPTRPPAPSPG